MIENRCGCCNKVLSKEKLETEHGCLDCAGYTYMIEDKWVCVLCLKNKFEKLKSLILLIDPVVSNVEINELSVKQWQEFIECFPSEGV